MKKLPLVLLIVSQLCFGQKNTLSKASHKPNLLFPVIPKYGKTLNNFVVKGWVIKDTAIGDLNKDKKPDAAMILEYDTLVKETVADTDIDNIVNDHPRILLILFKSGDHYEMKLQHNTFILRSMQRGEGQDPYNSIEITKGVLNINFDILFQHFRKALHYKIRYQNNDFYLIGETSQVWANSGTTRYEINYSTGKIIDETTWPAESNQKTERVIKYLPKPIHKKLSELIEAGIE